MLSSGYDRVGIASPFVLGARLIVQSLCRLKIGWDDPIPEEQRLQWEKWTRGLDDIAGLRVPRCLQPSLAIQKELHPFSDASEVAYGVASYLRAPRQMDECTATS